MSRDSWENPRQRGGKDTKDTKDKKDTPYDFSEPSPFPSLLYELIPKILLRICHLLRNKLEADIFLVGAISVLASCMPNVRLRYGSKWQSLNLNCCVVAPAGSGKGKIELARSLGGRVNKYLIEKSREAIASWEEQRAGGMEVGERPRMCLLFMPGDSSAAALKEILEANPHVCIFETEIKTVTTALNQEWGSWRDVFLKSFHNEEVSVARKDAVLIVIPHPALSSVLTGTPGTFLEIISDAEDGLYSRMCFFYFDDGGQIVNQFADGSDDLLDRELDDASLLCLDIHRALIDRPEPLYVTMEEKQQDLINQMMRDAASYVRRVGADEALLANVKRAGLIAFRIAGTLAILRHAEQGESLRTVRSITPTWIDVRAAVLMTVTFLENALRISSILRRPKIGSLKENMREYLDALPFGDFTTEMADEIALALGVIARKARRWRRAFADAELIKDLGYGKWQKPKPASCMLNDLSVLSILSGWIEGKEEPPAAAPAIEEVALADDQSKEPAPGSVRDVLSDLSVLSVLSTEEETTLQDQPEATHITVGDRVYASDPFGPGEVKGFMEGPNGPEVRVWLDRYEMELPFYPKDLRRLPKGEGREMA